MGGDIEICYNNLLIISKVVFDVSLIDYKCTTISAMQVLCQLRCVMVHGFFKCTASFSLTHVHAVCVCGVCVWSVCVYRVSTGQYRQTRVSLFGST